MQLITVNNKATNPTVTHGVLGEDEQQQEALHMAWYQYKWVVGRWVEEERTIRGKA